MKHYLEQLEHNIAFTSLAGEKYAAIGTSQGLFLYYGEAFF